MVLTLSGHNQLGQKDKFMTRIGFFGSTKHKTILHNFGFPTNSVKSAAIKTIIQKEFGDDIEFHSRYLTTQSTLVYGNKAGGCYIEAAIYSWGLSDEQLLNIVARRLNDRLRNDLGMKWPLTIAELENDE